MPKYWKQKRTRKECLLRSRTLPMPSEPTLRLSRPGSIRRIRRLNQTVRPKRFPSISLLPVFKQLLLPDSQKRGFIRTIRLSILRVQTKSRPSQKNSPIRGQNMDLCGLCTCAPQDVLNPNSPPEPFLVDVGKIVGYLGRYMRLQVRPI
jgi:hypothetical protein